jgi:hypothetical protein
MLTHHEPVDGAGCGLQVIWGIPEALRRERAKLDSSTRCAPYGSLSSHRVRQGRPPGRERVTHHLPFAARFLPAFFSSASFSTSPG